VASAEAIRDRAIGRGFVFPSSQFQTHVVVTPTALASADFVKPRLARRSPSRAANVLIFNSIGEKVNNSHFRQQVLLFQTKSERILKRGLRGRHLDPRATARPLVHDQ
jgi:hypothetical protein